MHTIMKNGLFKDFKYISNFFIKSKNLNSNQSTNFNIKFYFGNSKSSFLNLSLLQKMGITHKNPSKVSTYAQTYKRNLYQRIQTFQEKYKNDFNMINQKLKEKVIMLSAKELVDMLDKRQVTSYQLILIFAYRTSIIGIQNNYVLEELFEQALEKARQCDQERKKYPNKICWKSQFMIFKKQEHFPPFFGVPASYKDNIKMKGHNIHAGYVIPHQKNQDPQSGLFYELTLQMGFIPFVRSTVPMSCKAIDTNNHIFGYAKNPWDETRSCGGSSGGQGGLIAAYCSPIGFGTDIAGSLRIPAEFNGLVTLKPGQRYSKMGNGFFGKISGGIPVKAQIGPITRTVQDLVLFMNFICDQNNYKNISPKLLDPHLNLKKFSNDIFLQKPKLKIGYVFNLDTLSCSPSHKRVVEQSIQILRKNGHSVKQIKLPRFQQFYLTFMQLFVADGNLNSIQEIKMGQKLTSQFNLLKISMYIPDLVKDVLIWGLKNREPRFSKIIQVSKTMTVNQTLEKIYLLLTQLSNQIYQNFVNQDIQAIIMPGFAFPSPKLGRISKLQYCYSYTPGWNIINYPAGALPMSVVRQEQTINFEDGYNDSINRQIKFNLKNSQGMPVGIQIASLPNQQQKVLYLMQQIQSQVKFRQKHPCKKILEKKWEYL